MSTWVWAREKGALFARKLAHDWRLASLAIVTAAAATTSVVVAAWQLLHVRMVYPLLLHASSLPRVGADQQARSALVPKVLFAGAAATVAMAAWMILRKRWQLATTWLAPLIVAPLLVPLCLPAFEYEHAYLAGLCVMAASALVAWSAAKLLGHRHIKPPVISAAHTRRTLLGMFAVFVAYFGFLSWWRYAVFRAEGNDMTWELQAAWGVARRGIPITSFGAGSYGYYGQYPDTMPVPYFGLHAPFIYYALAPVYWIFRRLEVFLVLQAAILGSGCFGLYLLARSWFRSRWVGLFAAAIYLLHPGVQSQCLHDFHANRLSVPFCLIALGLMEAGRGRFALAAGLVAMICREETGLYAFCIGLFWLTFRPTTRKVACGLLLCAISVLYQGFVSSWFMKHFRGTPNWSRFSLYWLPTAGPDSLLLSFLLNPVGVAIEALSPAKLEYGWLTFLFAGPLCVAGWRAAALLLPSALLLIPSVESAFFYQGINYSAPLLIPALVMPLLGARMLLHGNVLSSKALGFAKRLTVTFVACCALGTSILYGNSYLAKTFKLNYGASPCRHSEYTYNGQIGFGPTLPPFGKQEKQLWAAISQVPKGAPVAAMGFVTPQLAGRSILYRLPYAGDNLPRHLQAQYALVPKVSEMCETTEAVADDLRRSPLWSVWYENSAAVIFSRKN